MQHRVRGVTCAMLARHWNSSFRFDYGGIIKLLIRLLPVKLSHSPFTHSLLIFLGNYLPKHNYGNRQTGWVRKKLWILHISAQLFTFSTTTLFTKTTFSIKESFKCYVTLKGVGGYMPKRYEALRGGSRQCYVTPMFLANSGNPTWFTVMSDADFTIIWLPFPIICSCA